MKGFKPAIAILAFLALSLSASAYVASIHVPAVLENLNTGNLTVIRLNITLGSGGVQINGPTAVQSDTYLSAQTAVGYAASYLGLNKNSYNFNYTIMDKNMSVSGPSGGLALTLLAVAGLQHKQLAQNFTATGTISSNGTVGLIGGVFDKSGAAKLGGMRYVLVPTAAPSSLIHFIYYLSQQTRNIPIIEVSNVTQALKYAFGSQNPPLLSLNITQGYNIASAGTPNITCTSCNTSAFSLLVNYTFGYTSNALSTLSSNFSSAKSQLLSNTQSYKALAARGFLYGAANLQFLDFANIFTLENGKNYTLSGATALISNISSFCSSLTPPLLTTSNYEFVIGANLRVYWANITLGNAARQLSNEQSTDDIISIIRNVAPAQGWCSAANELYLIASSMGGAYVQTSPNLSRTAASAINTARNYGNGGIYLQAAAQAYAAGDYATALYSATYAKAFTPQLPNMSNSQFFSASLHNIANASFGIWPSQFAAQTEFYLRQYSASPSASAKNGYVAQAYTTSLLAYGLAQVNLLINSSFVPSNATSLGVSRQTSQQIGGILKSISQIYAVLLLNALLLIIVLVIILVHILPKTLGFKPIVPRHKRGGPSSKRR